MSLLMSARPTVMPASGLCFYLLFLAASSVVHVLGFSRDLKAAKTKAKAEAKKTAKAAPKGVAKGTLCSSSPCFTHERVCMFLCSSTCEADQNPSQHGQHQEIKHS